MRTSIVLGMAFGDEGKGLTTSYLASHSENPLIVRFNGGAQAGHTVVHEGNRHVFSHYGAGALSGADTYWSEFCPLDPYAVVGEHAELAKHGISPSLIVHPLCPVVTPFDKMWGRKVATDTKHGSTGYGFGQTIQRNEDHYRLYAQDLYHPFILGQKLRSIVGYYAELGMSDMYVEKRIPEFLSDVAEMKGHGLIQLRSIPLLEKYDHVIFEGAQGILLDMDFGIFPHVTRSNTTSKNALHLINKWGVETDTDMYYITRSYQTRHGNGPMSNTHMELILKNHENETNITNEWQGHFRTSVLDADLLRYSLECDNHFSSHVKNKNLVISCMDQIDELRYTSSGKIVDGTPFGLVNTVGGGKFYGLLTSNGPTTKDIFYARQHANA